MPPKRKQPSRKVKAGAKIPRAHEVASLGDANVVPNPAPHRGPPGKPPKKPSPPPATPSRKRR